VSAATQIYYTSFDAVFFKLPLGSYPHHRLRGSNRFRARVGDYRVIYTIDLKQNIIHLLAIGHPREIYRRM